MPRNRPPRQEPHETELVILPDYGLLKDDYNNFARAARSGPGKRISGGIATEVVATPWDQDLEAWRMASVDAFTLLARRHKSRLVQHRSVIMHGLGLLTLSPTVLSDERVRSINGQSF